MERAVIHIPYIPDVLLMTWIVMIFLGVVSYIATRRLREVPTPFQNLIEWIVESLDRLIIDMMGAEGRKFLPLIGTIFIFILTSNLLGLIPGLASPTGNLNTTLALALVVFFSTHYYGIKSQGLLNYLKGFLGPNIWLAPLMLLIHLVTEIIRPFTLAIRLFFNILAEDIIGGVLFVLVSMIVIGVLKIAPLERILFPLIIVIIVLLLVRKVVKLPAKLNLLLSILIITLIVLLLSPFLIPLPIMFLHIFVAFIQALIFTFLAMLYIAGAMGEKE